MAFLKQAKSEDDVKKLTVSNLKKAYNELASDYNRILDYDYVFCPCCGEWKSRSNFYSSNKTRNGVNNLGCKKCIMEMATDYDKKANTYTDNKKKAMTTLRKLDLPYIDNLYASALSTVNAEVNEINRGTAWQQYMVMVSSLPQYRGKTWDDSELPAEIDDDVSTTRKIKASTKKRFGAGLSDEEYIFLQDQYEDWTTRYECKTKAQEELFERLSFKKLELFKATRDGKPTKDLDASYQQLMQTSNVTPKQNSLDAMSDAQVFGTLLKKWEETRPLPEVDPELQDVDYIGKYIEVFFRGHFCKLLNIKNRFSHVYDNFMKQYTVEKPKYEEDDEDTEEAFDRIFGVAQEDDGHDSE